MLFLVDHHLGMSCFEPADWRFLGAVGENGQTLVFRRPDGFWCKGRRGGSLYHFQSIHQVWELYIQAGIAPPRELVEDTDSDRRKSSASPVRTSADSVAVGVQETVEEKPKRAARKRNGRRL